MKPRKPTPPPKSEDPAVLERIASYKFTQAVKDTRAWLGRYPKLTDEQLRAFVSFHWPLSVKGEGWLDRVMTEVRR